MRNGTHQSDSFDEAIRYYRNAEQLLARCRAEGKRYKDVKPVRGAFGTAWLAIDLALKTALIENGVAREKFPKSWDGLLELAGSRLATRNEKLVRLLGDARELVHIVGYYHGEIFLVPVAAEAMELARLAIERLSGRKLI